MKRPLFAASLAYLAATSVAFFAPQSIPFLFLGAGAAGIFLFAAGGLFSKNKGERWKEYLVLPAAVALAASLFSLQLLGEKELSKALAGKEALFQGLVLESSVKPYGTRYLAEGQTELRPGEKFIIYLYAWEEQEAEIGQTIACKVKFEPWETVLKNGKLVSVRGNTDHVTVQNGEGLFAAALRARAWCIERVNLLFRGDVRAMVNGVLFGETENMEENTMELFRRSGTAHVLVVSGLHISILIYGLHRLLCCITTPQRAAWLAFSFLFLLAAIEGFTISVLRAAIMAALRFISRIAGREYDGLTAWGAAMLGILAWRPGAVGALSFWMSFGAVLGILLFSAPFSQLARYALCGPKQRSPWGPLFWKSMDLLTVSLSAQVFLFPIFLVFFRQVQVAAPWASLVVLPLLPMVMVFALGALVFSCLPGFGGFLALALCESTAVLCRLLLRFLKGAAGLPFAVLYTDSTGLLLWYVGAFLLLGSMLYLKGSNWQRKVLALLAVCLLSLEAGLAAASFAFREELRVDRTQNTAIITKGGSGAVLGSVADKWEAQEIVETLRCRRIKSLQLLLLRGEEEDNKGAALLTKEYRPQLTVLPGDSLLEEALSLHGVAYPERESYVTCLGNLVVWLPEGLRGEIVVFLKEEYGAANGAHTEKSIVEQ